MVFYSICIDFVVVHAVIVHYFKGFPVFILIVFLWFCTSTVTVILCFSGAVYGGLQVEDTSSTCL